MYSLENKLRHIKNKLTCWKILFPKDSPYLQNYYDEKLKFVDSYLLEIYEFEKYPINKDFRILILIENDFIKYLANHHYTMIFDGLFIKFALVKEGSMRFYVSFFRPTDL